MDTRHVETQTPDKHRCRAATALLAAVPCLTHTRTHYICILLPPALEAFPLHGSALAPAATPGGGGGGALEEEEEEEEAALLTLRVAWPGRGRGRVWGLGGRGL